MGGLWCLCNNLFILKYAHWMAGPFYCPHICAYLEEGRRGVSSDGDSTFQKRLYLKKYPGPLKKGRSFVRHRYQTFCLFKTLMPDSFTASHSKLLIM